MKVLKTIEWLAVTVVGGPVLAVLAGCLALMGMVVVILPGGMEIIEMESDRVAKWIAKLQRPIRHALRVVTS